MFGFGTQELLIILAIVLILFGANKIPQLGAGLGQGIANLKKGAMDPEDNLDLESVISTDEMDS